MDKTIIQQLHPQLQEHWKNARFAALTDIQKKTMPLILQGRDVIAHSPTGTGKTIAYLLPLLQQINNKNQQLQKLILAPSHELVMQIYQEIQKWSEGMNITSTSIVGGANIKRQIEKLKKRPAIIVGSPGRVFELIKLKKLKMHGVATIVLDEGDQLLEREHLQTIQTIVKSTLNERQLLLFSATEVKDQDQIKAMIGRQPEVVKVAHEKDSNHVEHIYLKCEQRERSKLLQKIAAMENVSGLVFVRSIGSMEVLAEKLQYEKVQIAALHSDMGKMQRERALTELRQGKIKLLLTTDIAARGLDIEGLTHVIHYDFPKDTEEYIHRSGRTGRMGAEGTVVSFVTDREERELKKVARELKLKINLRRIFSGQFVPVIQPKKKGNR